MYSKKELEEMYGDDIAEEIDSRINNITGMNDFEPKWNEFMMDLHHNALEEKDLIKNRMYFDKMILFMTMLEERVHNLTMLVEIERTKSYEKRIIKKIEEIESE